MKFQASELKHALKKLAPVKTDWFRFDGDTVVAQDSEATVVVPAPRFETPFTINAKKLSSVVNRMSGEIEATLQERSLVLKSAKARIELEIQPVKSVPLPESGTTQLSFNLPEFKKALALAVASASPAKSAAFGGVVQIQSLPCGLEDEHPPGYRIVGTDSMVLTVATIINTATMTEFKTLLNLTAAAIVQIMDGETLTISDTARYLVLKSRDTTVYASKPVQAYPNFDALLAKVPHTKFSLKPQEWLSAVRTVEPLIDEEKDKGVIGLHFFEGVVECKNTGVGSTASDEASYEQLDPDPIFDPKELNLRLTAKYLSGFLSRAGESATLGVTDGPLRLEADNVVMITMPSGGNK